MKIKRITSLLMALTVSCGVIQTVNNYSSVSFTAAADEQSQPTAVFDETTGTLTLSGKVDKVDVQKYKKATTVIAEAGTVLPEDCSELFMDFLNVSSIDLSKADTSKVTNMREMFGDCWNLKELNISGFNTCKVGRMKDMFYNCSSLETLDLSSFNTFYVRDMIGMFNGCKKLKTIYVGAEWETDCVKNYDFMFNCCANLVGGSGTVYSEEADNKEYARVDEEGKPGYFTASENYAAGIPKEMENTIVKKDNLYYRVFSDRAELFDYEEDNNDHSVVIPEKVNDKPVTSIIRGAFKDSTISKIEMPDTIKEIEDEVFYHCSYLKSVKFSKSLESIGASAFYNNYEIEEIELPDSLKTIGNYAFRYCEFDDLIIPESVKKIGRYAFTRNISKVTILSRNCELLDKDEYDNSCKAISAYIIYGYTGSTAEAYAKKYDIDFYALEDKPNVWGDANCDDGVDMADVVLVMQSLANPNKYGLNGTDEHHITEKGLELADVSRPSYEKPNGVTTEDALLIQHYLLRDISSIVPEHE